MTLSFNAAKALFDAGIVFERTEKAYLHVEGGKDKWSTEPQEYGTVEYYIVHSKELARIDVGVLIPAPCFDELWQRLPDFIEVHGYVYHPRCRKVNKTHTGVAYKSDLGPYLFSVIEDLSPTEAAGKLLLKLNELGVISPAGGKPVTRKMALRYDTLKVEIEKGRRFGLTRIGKCNSGFRLWDWSLGKYTLVTSISLAHCHLEWLRLKDEILNDEQRQNIEDHYAYVEAQKSATPKQIDYINRLREKKGLTPLAGQISKIEASEMIAKLS